MSIKTLLKKSCLFGSLPEKDLDQIKKIAHCKEYLKSDNIFEEGGKARGFYIVISGKVKVYKLSADGREQILHFISEGDSFGDAVVFHGKTYPAYAQALSDTKLVFIEKKGFVNLIREHPDISLKIMASLSAMLRDFSRLVEDLSLKEVSSRLAGYLVEQAEKRGKETLEGKRLMLDLNKTQLAFRLGTIPETLSRSFGKFKEQGIIRMDRNHIVILNEQALARIARGIKKD
jgi:CRP-like cAMP-binding protein